MIKTKKEALHLLSSTGAFFEDDEDDESFTQVLNMNDTWAWACSDGEHVPDESLIEVANLFFRYGQAGILYWVSERRGGMRSEFLDNNRFIDFVKNEEDLRKKYPDSTKRAYKKVKYTLGYRWFK